MVNWDRFSFDFKFSWERLFSLLVDIESYKEAALNLVLPPDWKEKLDRLNRVRAVHGTTALEGNPLSESEVSLQIDSVKQEKSGAGKVSKEQLQIRNAAVAQEWVKLRFTPGTDPVKLSDILHMHRLVTTDSDTKNNQPGALRSFPVTVGSPDMGGVHKGAPHERLPQMMEEFVAFINSRKLKDQHPVVQALLAHFFLVTIHPFGDGNGRVSRLLEAGILYQHEYNIFGFYGLSNYFYSHEVQYKTLLQQCRSQHPFDVAAFITFGVEGFSAELKGINNFIKTKLNRVIYRQMMVRTFQKRVSPRRRLLNQREWNLLDFLLTETEPSDPFSDSPSRRVKFSELRESQYIRGAYRRVTPRTFFRELSRLSHLGFILLRRDETIKDWIVELNFEAIGKY